MGGVAWLGVEELVSVSWDHTIKIWELELGGLKTELVANKVGIVDLKCEVVFCLEERSNFLRNSIGPCLFCWLVCMFIV